MENLNISTPNSKNEIPMTVNDSTLTIDNPSNNEEVMSHQDMIVNMFKSFLAEGGEPKVTAFKTHLNNLINTSVKPLCSRSGKSADGTDWRSVLKARFSGKGAKWVKVSIAEVESSLKDFESSGIDCSDYKEFINLQGYAWIRFSGARLTDDGHKSAAFEVRTGGSKLDHTKQLHLIPVDMLEDTVEPLNGTPNSLNLESAKKEIEEANETIEEEVSVEVEADRLNPENLQDVYEDFVNVVDDDLNNDIF